MAQRDYLLRLIEEAGRALRALRDRVLARDVDDEKLEQELADQFERVGLDPDLALRATTDTLILLVAPTGEVDATRCWILAESLYLTGLNAALEGRDADARPAFERALPLYHLVAPGAAFYGLKEAVDRIEEIEGRLHALPPAPGPVDG